MGYYAFRLLTGGFSWQQIGNSNRKIESKNKELIIKVKAGEIVPEGYVLHYRCENENANYYILESVKTLEEENG
jgi:hypothetical protein